MNHSRSIHNYVEVAHLNKTERYNVVSGDTYKKATRKRAGLHAEGGVGHICFDPSDLISNTNIGGTSYNRTSLPHLPHA